jgi:aspartate/methionine/tyrosine aminotransferase
MARDVGGAAVPGSSFFSEPTRHLVRFHFARKTATLEEAGSRLQRIREAWSDRRATA